MRRQRCAGAVLTCLALVPGAVERRRDPAHDGLRVRLVHRPRGRRHRVVGPDPEEAGARGAGWGQAGDGGGGRRRREEGAEQDELPAECRGGDPHAPPVRLLLVSPRVRARARGPAHEALTCRLPWNRQGRGVLETAGAVDSGEWSVLGNWKKKNYFVSLAKVNFFLAQL